MSGGTVSDAYPSHLRNQKTSLMEQYDSGAAMEVENSQSVRMPADHISSIINFLDERLPNGKVVYVNEAELIEAGRSSCALCCSILLGPLQSHCGLRVCWRCIQEAFNGMESLSECPLPHDEGYDDTNSDNEFEEEDDSEKRTRVYTIAKDFPPDHYTRKQLDNELVYCLNQAAGCTVHVKLKDLQEHVKQECEYELIHCPNSHCKETYMRRNIDSHQMICPHAEIACPDCHDGIKRSRLAYHCDNFCPMAEQTGCLCGKEFSKRSELLTHKEISSDERCMTEQKENVGLRCGFSKYGCTSESSNKENRKQHVLQYRSGHLAMVTIAVQSIKRMVPSDSEMKLVSKKLRPLEMQVGTLFQNIQTSRNKLDETEEARKGMDNMQKQLDALRRDIESLKRSQEASERRVETKYGQMDKIVDKMKTQLINMKATLVSSSDNAAQSLSVSFTLPPVNPSASASPVDLESKIPSMNGELVFTISNFKNKRAKAQNNEEISFYSPPFFSSPGGYKMCMRVYPNGDNSNKGKNLSVFFCLCKGPNDHTLDWPFTRKICFAVLKCGTSEIAEKPRIFVPDKSIAFIKPVREMNPSTGCPDFCSLNAVESYLSPVSGDLTLVLAVAPLNTDSWYHKINNYRPP